MSMNMGLVSTLYGPHDIPVIQPTKESLHPQSAGRRDRCLALSDNVP